MKKIAALLILVLCLVLAACGQEGNAPVTRAPGEDMPAASADGQASSGEAEATEAMPEEFVEPTTAVEQTTPDGGQVTFYLDALGRAMSSVQDYPGGYHHEFTYYPSGGTEIWIMTDPSGYCYEEHYMDNGYVKDGIPYDGSITYRKMTDPDGNVTETVCEYDEKGNRIEKSTSSDGTYTETHIAIQDGMETVVQTVQKMANGSYSEVYYENGQMTKSIYGISGTGEGDCHTEEYYENGIKTKHFQRDRDGEWTEEYDAQGNPLVSHRTFPDGSTYETFYDNGNKTYEIGKNADGTFVEWRYEGMSQTEYIEGRFNEAGVRIAEMVSNEKNRTLEEYERNDAGVVTYYYWTNHSVDKFYYFDDSGVLVKYVERIDGEDTTTTNPDKLAQIAAELDLEND